MMAPHNLSDKRQLARHEPFFDIYPRRASASKYSKPIARSRYSAARAVGGSGGRAGRDQRLRAGPSVRSLVATPRTGMRLSMHIQINDVQSTSRRTMP